MIKYGVNEQKMLKDIYPEVDILMQNCSVTSVYDSVLRHAFLNEIESQAVSNFREIYQKVFVDATLYRDTEEFEKLCGRGFEFEELRKEFYKKYSQDFVARWPLN